MKTGPDALNTVENDRVWERKILKLDPNALSIVENKSGGAKHENKTQRPRYRPKRVEERKIRKRYPTPLVPVRPFFARSAPPLGDGMRKKDTEIPPKRASV
jgi:hypothetical protein